MHATQTHTATAVPRPPSHPWRPEAPNLRRSPCHRVLPNNALPMHAPPRAVHFGGDSPAPAHEAGDGASGVPVISRRHR
ncbi:hypothetical protein OOT46_22235 [Aquabacterium sp. A7-Y]|uniref:hypothetical protein n=1 Tax=Aquabacterium sp. A7-Y TaxID=1349605 RepID=UPI00223CFE0F|nr:hypothetical protein [Aquabacterium sp. A7-Y]MCW7540547.1 hypothetical protein [Aquabacterium sp. A7-Y]